MTWGRLSSWRERVSRCGAVVLSLAALAGCATFSRDLERARDHYDKSELPEALALLRLLSDDQGALSPREQVEYTYLRGMTDFRLADTQAKGPTRDAFRASAETYLRLATALDRERPGALSAAQKARLDATLASLEGREPEGDGARSEASD